MAGYTESIDFPTTTGAFQTTFGGGFKDAFVSKLDPNLTTLIASTFFGGSAADRAYSIALDSSGNVYVAGETNSANFPTTTGAFQTTFSGGFKDAFISKLDPNLTTLIASTFLGGFSSDRAYSIALDSSGNVYVAGETFSTDFPTTTGAFQTTFGGGFKDAFVSKLDPNLSANNPPVISSFTVSPTSGTVPLTVTFSWSVSDADNNQLTCAIDVNSDGNPEHIVSNCTSGSWSYTYGTDGNYTATLTVDDGNGGITSKQVNITVTQPVNNPPVISSFSADPGTGTAPLNVTFSWNVSDPDGDTLICILDPGDGSPVYTISNCANNTFQMHTYTSTGSFTAVLRVDDGRGGLRSVWISIKVNSSTASNTLRAKKGGCSSGEGGYLALLFFSVAAALRRFFRM